MDNWLDIAMPIGEEIQIAATDNRLRLYDAGCCHSLECEETADRSTFVMRGGVYGALQEHSRSHVVEQSSVGIHRRWTGSDVLRQPVSNQHRRQRIL